MKTWYNEHPKKLQQTTKKSVDIESEFIGKPVAPRKKREKHPDLTDEIRMFLNSPISLEAIKRILLIMVGFRCDDLVKRSSIAIFNIDGGHYLIKISEKKRPISHVIYLSSFCFSSLSWFRVEKLDTSFLRKDLAHAIQVWCTKNPDSITILP